MLSLNQKRAKTQKLAYLFTSTTLRCLGLAEHLDVNSNQREKICRNNIPLSASYCRLPSCFCSKLQVRQNACLVLYRMHIGAKFAVCPRSVESTDLRLGAAVGTLSGPTGFKVGCKVGCLLPFTVLFNVGTGSYLDHLFPHKICACAASSSQSAFFRI